MNEHIALVKKWLANKDSVSQEELEDNATAAEAAAKSAPAYDAAYACYDANAYDAADACYGADAAADAAYYAWAAAYAATYDAALAAYYVKKYEELTNEQAH